MRVLCHPQRVSAAAEKLQQRRAKIQAGHLARQTAQPGEEPAAPVPHLPVIPIVAFFPIQEQGSPTGILLSLRPECVGFHYRIPAARVMVQAEQFTGLKRSLSPLFPERIDNSRVLRDFNDHEITGQPSRLNASLVRGNIVSLKH